MKMDDKEKEVYELADYMKTLVPPGVTKGLALKAFAILFADAVFQMDKNKGTIFDAAKGLFECYYDLAVKNNS